MVRTKPSRFEDAGPQIATNEESVGHLLAVGGPDFGALEYEMSEHGVG